MKELIFGLFFVRSLAFAGPFQASVQTPALLANAQQAYLEGNSSVAINKMKQAYLAAANDTIAQKSILQLYKKIRSTESLAKIDVGWELPKEVSSMRVSVVRRVENQIVTHALVVAGDTASEGEISEFQLIRYPDTIVLDKSKKIGIFDDKEDSGKPSFDYRTRTTPFDVSEGLYLMNFTSKSGSKVSGWFFLDEEMNSTAQPQLFGVDHNPIFTTDTPKVSWADFKSPQYNPEFEHRTISLWVGEAKVGKGHWNFWTSDVAQRSAVLGSPVPENSGFSAGPLANGDYYVLLSFGESHKFGPLRIARRSSVAKYFSVKK